MPPKKEPPGEVMDASEEKELVEKELVISYLKSKLGRYQEQGERLQVSNFKLLEELDKQKLNLRDINEFLTNELKARSLTTTAMEERVVELTQQMEELRSDCEAEVARVRAERARDAEAMGASMAELTRKMALSQEFLDKRDSMEGELAALRAQLDKQLWDHKAQISNMERLHLQEKERWRRETATKIKETKLQMAQLADTHLEQSTKRTILENEALSHELEYHKSVTNHIMDHNMGVRSEAAEFKRQAEVAQTLAESLARKNLLLQRTLSAVLAHFKQYKASLAQQGPGPSQQLHHNYSEGGRPLSRSSSHSAGRRVAFSEGGGSSSGEGAGPRSVLGEPVTQRPSSAPDVAEAAGAAGDAAAAAERAATAEDGWLGGEGGGVGGDGMAGDDRAAEGQLQQQQQPGDDGEVDGSQGAPEAAATPSGIPAHHNRNSSQGLGPSTQGLGHSAPGLIADELEALRELTLQLEAALAVSEQKREAVAPSAPISAALHEGVTAFVLSCVGQLRAKPPPVGSLPPWQGGRGSRATAGQEAAAVLQGVHHHVREQLAQYLLDQLHSYPGARQLVSSHTAGGAAEGARTRGVSAVGSPRKSGAYGFAGAGLVLRSTSALGHNDADREGSLNGERSAASMQVPGGVSPDSSAFGGPRTFSTLAVLLPPHLQADMADALSPGSYASPATASAASRGASPWRPDAAWGPAGTPVGAHLGGATVGTQLGVSQKCAAASPASPSLAKRHSPRLPVIGVTSNGVSSSGVTSGGVTTTGVTSGGVTGSSAGSGVIAHDDAASTHPTDDLVSAVLSDVRPWGRLATEQHTTPGTATFLRKGAGSNAAAGPLSPQRAREGLSHKVSFVGSSSFRQ